MEYLLKGTPDMLAPGGNRCILLYGPPGTGKSTLAERIPLWFEANRPRTCGIGGVLQSNSVDLPYVHRTRCKSERAADVLNDLNARLTNSASFSSSGVHYEIVDEFDQLTAHAQEMFKSIVDDSNGTIFIFTTNHFAGIAEGVKDRSHLFNLGFCAADALVRRATAMLQCVGVTNASPILIRQIAVGSGGSLRKLRDGVEMIVLTASAAN